VIQRLSWNRALFNMDGYKVVFVPFTAKGPAGTWEPFADGFPGRLEVKVPRDAAYWPTGHAVGTAGELYISDDTQGRVWRVRYQSDD
jgi:glucose/arabinose dehydrogenase